MIIFSETVVNYSTKQQLHNYCTHARHSTIRCILNSIIQYFVRTIYKSSLYTAQQAGQQNNKTDKRRTENKKKKSMLTPLLPPVLQK